MNKKLSEKVLPFDFIPLNNPPLNRKIEEQGNRSGTLTVRLVVQTPMIAINENNKIPIQKRGDFIPGSSIKGMLRNAAEIIWNGRLSVVHDDHWRLIPPEWTLVGSRTDSHCEVSHLFGFVDPKPDCDECEEKGRITTAYASKLIFSDALPVGNQLFVGEGAIKKHTLSSPKKFYKTKNGQIRGRKVYLAGRLEDIQSKLKLKQVPNRYHSYKDFFGDAPINRDDQIELFIFPNSEYIFTIRFRQLEERELAELIHLLQLTKERYHALGKGKPLGLGRVQFIVESIKYRNRDSLLGLNTNFDEQKEVKRLIEQYPTKYTDGYKSYFELLDGDFFDQEKSYGNHRNKVSKVRLYSEVKGQENMSQNYPKGQKGQPSPKKDQSSIKPMREKHRSNDHKRQEFSQNLRDNPALAQLKRDLEKKN